MRLRRRASESVACDDNCRTGINQRSTLTPKKRHVDGNAAIFGGASCLERVI
jgi:hypothetical protein